MGKIERFIRTAGIYFLGNVFTKLVSFLLLPLYTNKIQPSDFGNYGLVQSLSNLIIPLVFFQIWDSVFRFSFDYEDNKDKFKVINNGFIVMQVGMIIYALGFWIVSTIFPFKHKILIFLYSLGIGFQYFYSVIARSLQDNSLFVLSGCINSAISIILNVVLIAIYDRGVESLYISSIVGIFAQVLVINHKIKPLNKLHLKDIEFNIIKKYIRFSAPLSISTVSQWLLSGFTQLVISTQIGSYANGLFAIANKFSSILLLIVGIFQFAWNETAYILSNYDNKTEYYKRSVTEILKITILGSGLFLMLIKLVFPYVIGNQYQEALKLIPIVMVGTTANLYSGFLGTIFLANKNTNTLFQTTIFSSIANIIGIFILVPKLGVIGATLSLCIAFIGGALLRAILMKKSEGITPDKHTYTLILLLMISIFAFYSIHNTYILIFSIIAYSCISFLIVKPLVNIIVKIIMGKIKNNG